MARAAKTTAPTAGAAPGTAVVNWDAELAKQATMAAAEEAGSGGQFFSVKAGQLTFQGEAFPNNEMAVVALDNCFEHAFYAGKYDPDQPAPPTCFALGRGSDAELAPHEEVLKLGQEVNPVCAGCPNGEYGSADQGKGRACRWTKRLALLPAGGFVNGQFKPELSPSHYEKAAVGYFKIPPTSVKFWSGMVKQAAAVLKRPPHALFIRIKAMPDAKTQVRVEFETLAEVPRELLPILMKRNQEQQLLTMFPYQLDAEPAATTKRPTPKSGRPAPAAKPKRKY